MMMGERAKQWQQLLELSDTMLRQAREGEWDSLNSMAVVRQAALERFFAEPVKDDDVVSVAEGIHAINRIDSEITLLAKSAYDNNTQQQELLKMRQQAFRAYTDPEFRQG